MWDLAHPKVKDLGVTQLIYESIFTAIQGLKTNSQAIRQAC